MVTVLSVVAVGLAGAAAVGANIGILGSASDSSEDLLVSTPSSQVVDVYLPSTSNALGSVTGAQRFVVDAAGTVALTTTEGGLALDEVLPSPGWNWTLVQSASSSLMVTFTNGVRTLEFTASSARDGAISTSVSEPVAGSAQVVCDDHEDDHEDDDHDDEEVDDDGDHEDDVYECEYEGSDDDD